MRILLPLTLSLAVMAAAESKSPSLPRNVLTNSGVVALAEAGYDEDFVIDLIQSRPTRFDLEVEALADLARQGISERVVRAMLGRPHGQGEFRPMVVAPAPAPVLRIMPAHLVPAVDGAAGGSRVISKRSWLLHRKWYIVVPQPDDPVRHLPVW